MQPADLANGVGAEARAQAAQKLREEKRQLLFPGRVIGVEHEHPVFDIHRADVPRHALSRHFGPTVQQGSFPRPPVQARLSQDGFENGPDGFGPAFLPVS